MRRILAVLALAAMMCVVASAAQAAKMDEKTADVYRLGSFFHGEQIDFDAYLYVEAGVWHDNLTSVVKIDKEKYPSSYNKLQYCWAVYLIVGGYYYPIDDYCGEGPTNAFIMFDSSGFRFVTSGIDLSCVNDVGPFIRSVKEKAVDPKGLDQKANTSNVYWYNLDSCSLVLKGENFAGYGQQIAGVAKRHIKDPTY